MIRLTDRYDNYFVVNASMIKCFKMCSLGDYLGVEITLSCGTKKKVKESYSDIDAMLNAVNGIGIIRREHGKTITQPLRS